MTKVLRGTSVRNGESAPLPTPVLQVLCILTSDQEVFVQIASQERVWHVCLVGGAGTALQYDSGTVLFLSSIQSTVLLTYPRKLP